MQATGSDNHSRCHLTRGNLIGGDGKFGNFLRTFLIGLDLRSTKSLGKSNPRLVVKEDLKEIVISHCLTFSSEARVEKLQVVRNYSRSQIVELSYNKSR